jgi:Mg2+-importing ATPase
MCLVGFLHFVDPPKAEAKTTLHRLAARGIRVKIVTGDNRHVAAHVAQSVGLDAKSLLTGEQINAMNDEALWHRAPKTTLFVEVDPQQKERIVRALQHGGHAVGYLGDGINDAPSLHAADVGISVDQAADVARESADVVLLRPDLGVLCQGVEDGRRTFANTLKYIGITISANFGNMVSMALAAPLLPFLPLAAKQILLNNFLSDLPMIAVSADNTDPDRLAHAQRWNARRIRSFMIAFGLISTAFDLLAFALLLEVAPSRLLLGTTLVVGALALCLPYLGPVARAFGFVPLPAPLMGAMVAIVLAYLATTEAAKRALWRRWP